MMTRPAGSQKHSSWLASAAGNAVLAGLSIYTIGQAGLAVWMFGDASLVGRGLDSVSGPVNPPGHAQPASPAKKGAQ